VYPLNNLEYIKEKCILYSKKKIVDLSMLKIDNKIILSWDDLDSLVNKLCVKIPLELPNIDSVTGIARGGLIPAVMISHKLDLPYVSIVGPNTLVIDDIADTGITLGKAPGVFTAVLHYKPHTSGFKPNLWADTHNGDEWILFPWERQDSKQIQDYLIKG
jgi:hypoxanthine phosphoribosyltransferase